MPNWPQALSVALEHQRAGRPQEAEKATRQVLQADPSCAEAWHLLAHLASQAGQHEAALECSRKACNLQPRNAEFHHDLGVYLSAVGRRDEALASLRETLRLQAHYPEAHNQLGLMLALSGQLDKAVGHFRQAYQQRPGYAAANGNLGNALKRLGRLREAELAFLHAIRCDPRDAIPQFNLGLLLEQRGQPAEAVVSYRNALQLAPGLAEASRALARVLGILGRAEEAVEVLRGAAALHATDPVAHNDLGNLLQDMGRNQEAEAAYSAALQAGPQFAPAHANLGYLLADQGRLTEAERHYQEGLRLQPTPRLRVVAATMLPPIYTAAEDVPRWRQRLEQNLRRLYQEGVRLDPTREIFPTLFYLAYQGGNDRDLQTALARLAQGPRALSLQPAPRTGGAKIHVGFLSHYLKDHTIGLLNAGLIAQLDRRRFTVTVLSAGCFEDEVARRIRSKADRFLILPTDLPTALRAVADQGLDILFYPDVGMDPFTYTLAFTRLAPVQCVTWGHPVTTGIPGMDYYLSSQDLETEDGDKHYSEKLIRLATPAVYYSRPALPPSPKGRDFFGLPEKGHLYACPQTPFKFHPDFDEVLGGILRRDPEGILVLVESRYPTWRELLWQRFGKTLPDVRQRIHFVSRLERPNFLSLLALADVLLDPIHFGGGNTSFEGLALGVPIVTLPSNFLRGRITYALYRKMGLMNCVATSPEDYIGRAVQLGTDAAWRTSVRQQIQEKCGVLFEDATAVHALEDFFQQVAKRPS